MRRFCGFVIVAGLLLISGCYKRLTITMERSGSNYVLHFKYGGGQDAAVNALFVSTVQDGKDAGTICEWGARLPLHPLVGTWIYGSAVPAEYEKKGCAPLTPGLYRVQALGSGHGGILDVRIDPAGNVQPQ